MLSLPLHALGDVSATFFLSHLIGGNELQGPRGASLYTCRVAPAEVALYRLPVVKRDGPERTCFYTQAAPDTSFGDDLNQSRARFPEGSARANGDARSVLALSASDRDVDGGLETQDADS